MRIDGGDLLLAATDVSNHVGCAHLTQLTLAVARGERKRPPPSDGTRAALQKRGLVHEAAYLDSEGVDTAAALRRVGATEVFREKGDVLLVLR